MWVCSCQGHDFALYIGWRLVDAGCIVTLGMLLALTRHRPDVARLKKPRLVPTMEPIPDGRQTIGH